LDVARGPEVASRARGRPAGVLDRVTAASGDGPLGVALRVGGMSVAAVLASLVHRVHDPGILCPVRALTGVPCPFCGGTTVFMEMGAAHPVRALAANPVVLTGAVGLATAPLGSGRRWWAFNPRTRAWIIGAAVALSWLWQLARFGLLRF
jgi:Protein of unknown function (DUF2752)